MNNKFELSKIEEISNKFEARINEAQANINKLQEDYSRYEADLDTAIEEDIMNGSDKTAKNIQNLSARLTNIKAQLEIEKKTLAKAKELRANAVAGAIREYRQAYSVNMSDYYNDVEKPILEALAEIREKQFELLLQLLAERNAVANNLFDYNSMCTENGMTELKVGEGLDIFQNNITVPSPQFPELGSPIIPVTHLQHVQNTYERQKAEQFAKMQKDKKRLADA